MTTKERKFCEYYIELGNGSEAYRKAYNKPDLEPSQASTRAYELLQNSYIAERVKELQEELKMEHKIDRDFIVKGLLEVISDADYTFKLGKDSKLSKEDAKAFYRLMNQTKNTDKLRALEQLAKMLGLNEPDKVEHEVKTIEIIERKRE